jgi:hypothetical protein
MSAKGLGRVKTLLQKREGLATSGDAAKCGHFGDFDSFPASSDQTRSPFVAERHGDWRKSRVAAAATYALIAATSGPVPMMFITRVRL